MSGLSSLLQQHKERILSIAAHYRAQNLRVFGSVARGEDTADSDIDLLVDCQRAVVFNPGSNVSKYLPIIQNQTTLQNVSDGGNPPSGLGLTFILRLIGPPPKIH